LVSGIYYTNCLQSVKSTNLGLSVVEDALNEAPIFIFIGIPKKASPGFYGLGSQTFITGATDDGIFAYRSNKEYPIGSQHLGASVITVSHGKGSIDTSLTTIQEPAK
jgi:hypothetical protein